MSERSSHPFRMWDAILEAPEAVRRCLQGKTPEAARQASAKLLELGCDRVFLLGCGTSNYAAQSTAHALVEIAGIDADAYDSFEFSQYRLGLIRKSTAVITFSHSGATRATVDAARLVRQAGAFTVALTDFEESLLAVESDFLVPVGGGRENVEPKTRSYLNTVVVAYQIAAFLSESMGDPGLDRKAEAGKYLGALNLIPPALERSLALEPAVRQLAEKFAGVKRVFVIGSGPSRTTASEIALKFKEAVLLASEGFGAEEAFHGPIASLNEDTLVIGVSTPGPGYDKVGHFLKAVAHMGYPAVSVTPEPYDLDGVDTIRVNTDGIPEIFSGTVLVYPLYMLAYFSALARGLNPDIFRVGDEVFHEAMALVPSISYKV